MTHAEYLEAFHELTNTVLPEIALRQGRGDHDQATDLLTQLRAKQSDLWSQRVVTAQEGVNP